MQRFVKQLGQGMTEYIIIVALIAIAAIAAYGFFGDTLRSQVGGMASERYDLVESQAKQTQPAGD